MSNEKVWCNGGDGLKRNFSNGGSKTELDLKWDDFKAWGDQHVNDKGYVKLEIQGSREPRMDDKGNEKLNVSLNDWKPQQQQAPQQNYQQAPQQPVYQQPQAPQAPQQPQAPQAIDPSMAPQRPSQGQIPF